MSTSSSSSLFSKKIDALQEVKPWLVAVELLTLINTNQLNVRGFMGISHFGKCEIWTRYK